MITPQKPRIAVVTPLFPTREQVYRGQPIYATVLKLAERAKVRVFCPLTTYPNLLRPVRFHYMRTDLTWKPQGIDTEYFEYPGVPLLTRPVNGYVCARRLVPRLRRWGPELILVYWLYPEGFAAVIAGRKLGLPVVTGALGSDVLRIPDAITRWFTQRTLREANCTITVSEDLRRHAIRLGAPPERVKTVLNGCDTDLFRVSDRASARAELGVPADVRMILYVGRLDPGKGLEELLTAVAHLKDIDPFVVCVGDGLLEKALRDRAESLGITARVQFPGACHREQVARWLTACDVFCLPSHSEGCPNVVLEAIASGRPVVSTLVGGIPEVVNDQCGILVPPREIERLKEALAAALRREWCAATVSRQFQRTWKEVAAETYEICRDVLS